MIGLLLSCQEKGEDKLFRSLLPDHTGIQFSNDLTFSQEFNIFKYRNFYNGGGVTLADFNNDELLDIYLISNMSSNKLFRNTGDFKFDDVTKKAGVAGTKAWSTGVSVADVNGDGLLDIYVCNSGDIAGDNKQNELFINNGDDTFTESAVKYGLDDQGYSTHAAFFDYDKDGDLDMYLLNNSYQAIGSFDLRRNERPIRDSVGGDKLYRNQSEIFIDVSEEAGIYGSIIGFGLGVTVGDINRDGWLDIYVSNDFFERDYLYVNNRTGGFDEVYEKGIKSTSAASMGADMADLNNDGFPEIFVTDMLPNDNERLKTVTTFDSWDRYQYSVQNGYGNQFTRNTLQLNNGDETFSEIGRFSNVEASDWSWGALIFDFQNDGFKDIFVANGIYQDLTNQDFLQFVTQNEVTKKITAGGKVDYKALIDYIPSVPIVNHAYINDHNLEFSNQSQNLGFVDKSFSSGAAYGDLDNDGDLDLVINNTNMPPFIYQNLTEKIAPDNSYLRFILKGKGKNTNALGTNITVHAGTRIFYLEHLPARGFESTVDNRPLIGTGNLTRVDSVIVKWPLGNETRLKDVTTNQDIVLDEADGTKPKDDGTKKTMMYQEISNLVDFDHKENSFVDFDRDRLTFQMLSSQGPCMCKGDINKDGLDDLYIGGAADQEGYLAIQSMDGTFNRLEASVIDRDKGSEDVDCTFFDANGDGNLDLYVVSGGSDFEPGSPVLGDRLYISGEKLKFNKYRYVFPANKFESTSVVTPADYDGDNDIDLFVGGRLQTYSYGLPRNGYILQNDGSGNFTNVSDEIASSLAKIGMITDAKWSDVDGDNDLDLIIVGEWMPITILTNESGFFVLKNDAIPNSSGWWNTVEVADLNGDDRMDIVAGNHGLNSRFRATKEFPLHMFINDFDKNGTMEQIICQYEGDKLYPLPLRHDLAMQMPQIKKRYLKYESFKDQEITDIFSEDILANATKLKAHDLGTRVFFNNGSLDFTEYELPKQAQFSCTYAIAIEDFNGDDIPDILLAGNLYDSKPEMGRYDASYGTFLIGDGARNFDLIPPSLSGLKLDRQVREIQKIRTKNGFRILVANNNDAVQAFEAIDQ